MWLEMSTLSMKVTPMGMVHIKIFFNVVVTQGVKQQDGGRENMSFDFGFIRITFDYFS